jgi:hypothetical protein
LVVTSFVIIFICFDWVTLLFSGRAIAIRRHHVRFCREKASLSDACQLVVFSGKLPSMEAEIDCKLLFAAIQRGNL